MSDSRNHIDLTILICVLALMLLSLGIVYSASSTRAADNTGSSEYYLAQHAARVFAGIVCIFFFMRIDYHRVQRLSKIVLMLLILILFATLITGYVAKGAKRWISLGFIGFQPSELVKFALLFHLTTLIVKKGELVQDFKRGYIPMLTWIGLVTLLVMAQPNFSMSITIFSLGLMMLYIGNARLKHLIGTFAALIPLLALGMLIRPYSLDRIKDYIDRLLGNSQTTGQLFQSLLAFGSGGIFGLGPGESKQREYFLPEAFNDFIYSIVGEEYGFLGTVALILVFFLIMYRGFKIAKYSPDPFGRYLGIAITLAITFNALVNACVSLGLFPTTGLPMPFVSYGGTSMVVSGCAIGILLNISSQTEMNPRTREIPVMGDVNAGTIDPRKVY
jgi:cell division protein FtsW